jgi:hypothetical protein
MMIVVGCKNIRTTHKKTILSMTHEENLNKNRPTLQFVIAEEAGWATMNFPYNETESVNDVSWGLMNGRSYHLVAMSTDTVVRIFYIKIN